MTVRKRMQWWYCFWWWSICWNWDWKPLQFFTHFLQRNNNYWSIGVLDKSKIYFLPACCIGPIMIAVITKCFQLIWSSCTQSDQPSSSGKYYHMEVTFPCQLLICLVDETSCPGEQRPGRGGDQHCGHLQDWVHHPDAVNGSKTLQDRDFQGVLRFTTEL